jgi:hypothetical protein
MEAQMIDTFLINRAKPISEIIESIDDSWEKYMKTLNAEAVCVPFDETYYCRIKAKRVYVKGYEAEYSIDKIFGDDKLYHIKKPIVRKEFAIVGVFDNTGKLAYFISEPVIGFHYLGMNGAGDIPICTGELRCPKIETLAQLKAVCKEIHNSLRVCNLYSLGDTHLPAEFDSLRGIIHDPDYTASEKIHILLEERMIKPIL